MKDGVCALRNEALGIQTLSVTLCGRGVESVGKVACLPRVRDMA